MWKWSLVKLISVPVAIISILLILYSSAKVARQETEGSKPTISSNDPNVKIDAVKPSADQAGGDQASREQATSLFALASLGLIGSLGMFVYAVWKQSSGARS
jgi:hypothetical protein